MKLTLAWTVLLHSAAFCMFWLTNRAYHPAVNDFLAKLLGQPLNFVAIFIGFGSFVLACTLAVILAGQGLNDSPGQLAPWAGWVFAALGGFFLVFFYGSFMALFRQDPTQIDRLRQLGGYFRWLVDAVLLLGLTGLLGRFLLPIGLGRWAGLSLPSGMVKVTLFLVLAAAWLLPLLHPPTSVIWSALPPKPRRIAHRGASWLAPENTLAAMERAIGEGAYGLESDVHVSQEGVLFLMHDRTLERTTDVERFYPQRANQHASSFTLAELAPLNAGEWFVRQDPFGTLKASLASEAQVRMYTAQAIPLLQDLLRLAEAHHQVVLYDLYDPPQGHPYHGQSLALSLQALGEANLGENAWVLAREDEIAQVRRSLPEATLVAGIDAYNPPPAERLVAAGYRVVNSEYPLSAKAIQAYQKAGLRVNLWTVDEPWQYARCWLLGVESVTTNNLHGLVAQTRPFLALSKAAYIVLWVGLGLLAAWLYGLRALT
jgi:glycerophosphoryl diester phosphodiesterase